VDIAAFTPTYKAAALEDVFTPSGDAVPCVTTVPPARISN
jgi:hypothetical protein